MLNIMQELNHSAFKTSQFFITASHNCEETRSWIWTAVWSQICSNGFISGIFVDPWPPYPDRQGVPCWLEPCVEDIIMNQYKMVPEGAPCPDSFLLQHSSVHMLVATQQNELTFTTEMKPIQYNSWWSIIHTPTLTSAHPKACIDTMRLKTEPVSEDALTPMTKDLCTMLTILYILFLASDKVRKTCTCMHTYINSIAIHKHITKSRTKHATYNRTTFKTDIHYIDVDLKISSLLSSYIHYSNGHSNTAMTQCLHCRRYNNQNHMPDCNFLTMLRSVKNGHQNTYQNEFSCIKLVELQIKVTGVYTRQRTGYQFQELQAGYWLAWRSVPLIQR